MYIYMYIVNYTCVCIHVFFSFLLSLAVLHSLSSFFLFLLLLYSVLFPRTFIYAHMHRCILRVHVHVHTYTLSRVHALYRITAGTLSVTFVTCSPIKTVVPGKIGTKISVYYLHSIIVHMHIHVHEEDNNGQVTDTLCTLCILQTWTYNDTHYCLSTYGHDDRGLLHSHCSP